MKPTAGIACLIVQANVIRALWVDGITWRMRARTGDLQTSAKGAAR